MGHKLSDGRSMVVANDSGGSVAKDDAVGISGIFGFADHDAADTEDVSVSIFQEEREVSLGAHATNWAFGDLVYFTGTVFDDVAPSAPWDVAVGTISRLPEDTAAGGIAWIIVHPTAFAGRA
jgi:hypothetical protein